MGRADTCDVHLTESAAISRRHARLQKKDQQWNITDLNSLNGIHINGLRVPAGMEVALHEKDVIEIGKEPDSVKSAVYTFQFYKNAKVRVMKDDEKGNGQQVRRGNQSSSLLQQKMANQERILKEVLAEKERATEQKIHEMQKRLMENVEQGKQLQEEKEKEKRRLEEQLQQEKLEIQVELKKQRKLMTDERERFMIELEHQAKEKESEKREVEAKLQEEADKVKLQEEQLKEIENIRNVEKEQLGQQLAEMEAKMRSEADKVKRHQELLDELRRIKAEEEERHSQQLSEVRHVMEQNTDALKEKDGVLENMQAVMENELICAICSELFIKATSLNCSHSFCEFCIAQWFERKNECPQCRSKITSKVRSIVLDNYIDHVTELLSDELKQRRKTLLEERRDEVAELEARRSATATRFNDVTVTVNGARAGAPAVNARVVGSGNAAATANPASRLQPAQQVSYQSNRVTNYADGTHWYNPQNLRVSNASNYYHQGNQRYYGPPYQTYFQTYHH